MRTIHYLDSVSSTNEVARRLAEEGAEHGEIVLAEWQTAGRGRRGASWHCPKGRGILASVILRPVEPRRVPLLSLAAALAVSKAIKATTGLEARTKWPNDVLIGGRKVAGILVEASLAASDSPFAVVGIGVNVNFHVEELQQQDPLSQPATTILDELGREIDRLTLLGRTIERFEEYSRSAVGGEQAGRVRHALSLLCAWRKADAYLGKEVRVRTGEKILWGIYEDVAEDGSLILLTADGQRLRLPAGEVRAVVNPETRTESQGRARRE